MTSGRSPAMPQPLTVALVGAALMLALQAAPDLPPLLEYRRGLLLAQPWRLFTAHVVHVNWTHALVNAAAWLLLARLWSELDARRQLLVLALAAAFISLALAALYPSIDWYRGASGMLHALFFAGATRELAIAIRRGSRRNVWFAAALLAAGWLKLALEYPFGGTTAYAEWLAAPTVPQAHLLGALPGTVLGLLFSRRRSDEAPISR